MTLVIGLLQQYSDLYQNDKDGGQSRDQPLITSVWEYQNSERAFLIRAGVVSKLFRVAVDSASSFPPRNFFPGAYIT